MFGRDADAPQDTLPVADARADAAAQLRAQTRRRVIGAAALLLGAVVLVPMLLDSAPRPKPDAVTIRIPTEHEAVQPRVDPPPEAPRSEVEPAPAETPPLKTAPAKTAATNGAKVFVQVAALSNPAAARDLMGRLKKAGFSAFEEAVAVASGTVHRVRIGPFVSRDEARRIAEQVRAAGFTAEVR